MTKYNVIGYTGRITEIIADKMIETPGVVSFYSKVATGDKTIGGEVIYTDELVAVVPTHSIQVVGESSKMNMGEG